jgi:hypothetical protein
MNRKLLLLLMVLAMAVNVSGVYIGTAPGVQDLGEVERGETYSVTFYTTASGFDSDIQVEPELSRPNSDFFSQGGDSYEFEPEEASEEDITPWINFRQDSFTVNEESRTVQVGGSRAEVNGEVNFFLDIPRDAEPGYHAARIDLNPDLDNQGNSQQVSTLSLSQFYLVFRVPGDAERDISVMNVEGLRSGDSEVQLNLNVRNTGTVTTQIRPNDGDDALNLLNPSTGEQIDEVVTGSEYIEPGETKEITTYWNTNQEIEAGSYRVRGSVDYITGNAIFDDSFDVTSFIQIEPSNEQNDTGSSPDGSGSGSSSTSMTLVLMVLVALGVLMYSFEIDPLWIISVVGFLGISSFILITGLPVYLIGIVLILTAAVFYVG